MSILEVYEQHDAPRDGIAVGYVVALFAAIYLHYAVLVPRPVATAAVGGMSVLPIAYLAWTRDVVTFVRSLPPTYLAAYALVGVIFIGHTIAGNYAFLTLGILPIYTSVIVFGVLFVTPRLVPRGDAFSAIAGIGAVFGIVGLAVRELEAWASVPGFTHPALKSSIYLDPNTTSLIAVVGLVSSLVYAARYRSLAFAALGLGNGLFLWLTNSRGGLLALVVALGFYATYTQLGARAALAGFVAGVTSLSAFVTFAALQPFHPIIESLPLTGRQYLWAGTVRGLLETNPLVGVGWVVASEWVGSFAPTGFTHAPHNSYLAVALRGGLVALAGYLVLTWGSVVLGIRQRVTPLVLAIAVGVTVTLFVTQTYFWGVNYRSVLVTLVFGYVLTEVHP